MGSTLSRQIERYHDEEDPPPSYHSASPRSSSSTITGDQYQDDNRVSPPNSHAPTERDIGSDCSPRSTDLVELFTDEHVEKFGQPALRLDKKLPGVDPDDLNLSWRCDCCRKTHKANYWDTPSHQPWTSECPKIVSNWEGLGLKAFVHQNHHVQLALTIWSLPSPKPVEASYLRRLLEPFKYERCFRNQRVASYCFCEVKIVRPPGRNKIPRFLKQRMYVFEKLSGSPTLEDINVYACVHQRSRRLSGCSPYEDSEFSRTIARAVENVGVEINGGCNSCLSDYAARYNGQRLEVRVWQDITVKTHCPTGPVNISVWFREGWDCEGAVHVLLRKAGSVRTLYGWDKEVQIYKESCALGGPLEDHIYRYGDGKCLRADVRIGASMGVRL